MKIREANINDALNVSKCIYKVWKVTYKDIIEVEELNTLKENSWEESNKKIVISDIVNCYVAEYNSEIVGVVVFGENRMLKNIGEIYALYVLPKFQKQHLGKKLLNIAVSELRTKYSKIQLKVMIKNTNARKFYENNNFVNTYEQTEDTIQGIKVRNIIYVYEK